MILVFNLGEQNRFEWWNETAVESRGRREHTIKGIDVRREYIQSLCICTYNPMKNPSSEFSKSKKWSWWDFPQKSRTPTQWEPFKLLDSYQNKKVKKNKLHIKSHAAISGSSDAYSQYSENHYIKTPMAKQPSILFFTLLNLLNYFGWQFCKTCGFCCKNQQLTESFCTKI